MVFLTPQIEADRRLLAFNTYEDYLDSLLGPYDACYLRANFVARQIAELGYKSSGQTLTRQQFLKRKTAVLNFLSPPHKPYELASEGITSGDRLVQELSIRERANRIGILSTIIYIRVTTGKGEISGYIDFHERLSKEDWKPFFHEGVKLLPNLNDLGYYHWGKKVMINESLNYKVIMDPIKGLVFQNRFDRKTVVVDPEKIPGNYTKRTRVFSDMCDHAVLFDHVVRQRI